MKKILLLLFITFLHVTACKEYNDGIQLPYVAPIADDNGLQELLDKTDWSPSPVANGIIWKHFQFPAIFGSRQYINIFDIDLSKNVSIDIPYAGQGKFFTVSEAGVQHQADVATNGSYFGTNYGSSTVYFRKNGTLISPTVPGFDSFRENSAFTIDAAGKPSVIKKPSGGWDQVNAPYVLAGGPLLVYEGKEVEQFDQSFNTLRHPRTVIGITADNHMLMVVVDGRSTQSQGLTTAQLAKLMLSLGCTSAINMDGGGSSTAWTKGQGVVNHPTDNGKFDHEGQREVSTVISVTAN